MTGRRLMMALGWAAVAGLLAPLAVAAWVSFSPDSFLTPPTGEWSLRWYRAFFADRVWTAALVRGVGVSSAAATVSVLIATSTAFAVRHRFPGRRVISIGVLLPAYLPAAVLGLGAMPALAAVGLRDSIFGLVLVHATLGLPIAFLVVRSHLTDQLDQLGRAARGLGASPWQTTRRVTLPLLRPALFAGWVAVFALSLNEVTVSRFLAGPSSETLAAVAWPELRFAASPKVAVAAGVNAGVGLLAVVVVARLARPR